MRDKPLRHLHNLADWFALLWLLALSYFSLAPFPELPELPLESDKFFHLIAYAGLSFLGTVKRGTIHYKLIILLTIIAYGGLIEIVQPYVNRYGEFGDFVANFAGAILGVIFVGGLSKFKSNQPK